MPIYTSLFGHVELPNVEERRPPWPPEEARVDQRPASRRRRRTRGA
jgi:hypothetical protein